LQKRRKYTKIGALDEKTGDEELGSGFAGQDTKRRGQIGGDLNGERGPKEHRETEEGKVSPKKGTNGGAPKGGKKKKMR